MNKQQAPAKKQDIVIVGGGMVGLSLALLLCREMPQLSVTIIESLPFPSVSSEPIVQPSFDERSTALSANTVEVLQKLDIWSELLPVACEIEQVLVSDRGHFGGVNYTKDDNGQKELGYVVGNTGFGRVLLEQVQGGEQINLIGDAAVESIKPVKGGVQIFYTDTRGEHVLFSGLVIIADGADSRLRAGLGIQVTEKAYGQHALIANVETDQANDGRAYERFTEQGPLALLPLKGDSGVGKFALVWTRPSELVDQFLDMSDDEFLQQLHCFFGYRQGRFLRVGQRVSYPLKLMMAQEQVRTGIVLMGNAAHFLHPVAGQGFNLALRDCVQLTAILGQALRNGDEIGSLSVLQRYVAEQEQDQWLTTFISHSFNQLFSTDRFSSQVLRTGGLLSLELLPVAKQMFFKQMMGQGFSRTNLQAFK